jgi:hypothetical protein
MAKVTQGSEVSVMATAPQKASSHPALLKKCRSGAIPQVLIRNGQQARHPELLPPLRIEDADLHEGGLALEEAIRQLTESSLITGEEGRAGESRMALERLLLFRQEKLDLLPNAAHRHTLQFTLAGMDIAQGAGQPDRIHDQERT